MHAYLRILRVPRLAPLLTTTLLARLPIGINGLAVVLFLRAETGSFAVAGAAAGALALGNGVGAPVAARLVDALGPWVLLALAGAHALGLGGLVLLGYAGAPGSALAGAALLAGVALPPTSSVMRSLYPRLLRDDPALVQAAYALDSVLTEALFIAGPLLTAALVALAEPAAALGLSAAAVVAGTAAFVGALPAGALARDQTGPGRGRLRRLGALEAPGVRTLVLSMLPVGVAFGALEVALPAFADGAGRPELAGLLIATWSVGSAAGGLVYGARPRRASLPAVHLRVAALLPVGFAPVALATSPAVMALLVIPAGVFIAPLLATRNELAGLVAPPGTATEAYTWPLTALVAGVALGAAAAGAAVDAAGWRSGALMAIGAAALGALVALARRATLRAAGAAPVPAAS
jgi:MFS family permease